MVMVCVDCGMLLWSQAFDLDHSPGVWRVIAKNTASQVFVLDLSGVHDYSLILDADKFSYAFILE